MTPAAQDPSDGWEVAFSPPSFDLDPVPAAVIDALFRGESLADEYERLLASAARVRGALDVELAEGLHALRQGNRLTELACHFDDYAREVLDLGKRAAEGLAALGAGLRTRPYLRDALRSGRVRLRAAETILPVTVGDDELGWVELAAQSTTRELEEAVRSARGRQDEETDWLRLRAHLGREERQVVDAALDLAGEVLPGSTRAERLEAMAQEFLGSFPGNGEDPERLGPEFRPIGSVEAERRAALEAETERWAVLAPVPELRAPDARFAESVSAAELDSRLRTLARIRAGWDAMLGHCALMVKRARLHTQLGFSSFRHYVEERLCLPPRAVEQRVKLEQRIWRSPPLREARRQGLPYEKLRLLALLPDDEISGWIPRAKALTCVALKRRVEGETEAQMRASRRFGASMPQRIAVVLAASMAAVRAVTGSAVHAGKCLVLLAKHFVEVWRPLVKRPYTRSRKVRARDEHECQVPGCSHRGGHSHHVLFRSRQGGDELDNQVALCAFHHLRCVHGASSLRVFGRAPDALTWFLGGKEWNGPGLEG